MRLHDIGGGVWTESMHFEFVILIEILLEVLLPRSAGIWRSGWSTGYCRPSCRRHGWLLEMRFPELNNLEWPGWKGFSPGDSEFGLWTLKSLHVLRNHIHSISLRRGLSLESCDFPFFGIRQSRNSRQSDSRSELMPSTRRSFETR